MKRIERIVVGTDFSEIAERAVDDAIDMAAQLGASVTVVHAYEIPTYSFPDTLAIGTADMAQTIATDGLKRLAATIERKKGQRVTIRSVLRLGPPWDEINAVAREEEADLIMIGTHGRRGFSRALLGSVAERTLRTAVRPVVIVHGGARPATN